MQRLFCVLISPISFHPLDHPRFEKGRPHGLWWDTGHRLFGATNAASFEVRGKTLRQYLRAGKALSFPPSLLRSEAQTVGYGARTYRLRLQDCAVVATRGTQQTPDSRVDQPGGVFSNFEFTPSVDATANRSKMRETAVTCRLDRVIHRPPGNSSPGEVAARSRAWCLHLQFFFLWDSRKYAFMSLFTIGHLKFNEFADFW